jgi:hypothetical protein
LLLAPSVSWHELACPYHRPLALARIPLPSLRLARAEALKTPIGLAILALDRPALESLVVVLVQLVCPILSRPFSRILVWVIMHPRFAALVDTLAPKLDELIAKNPVRYGKLPKNMPEKGVYLFSRGQEHLYVGRSNLLRNQNYRHFGSHRSAAFAFMMARKETSRLEASYKKGVESRDGLMKDGKFADAFAAAKREMKEMDYRYVEEQDQVRQALLESISLSSSRRRSMISERTGVRDFPHLSHPKGR